MNDNRSAPTLEESATIRDRIRRSYLFLVLNRNPATRKALERLIKQAEAQLSLSLSAERIETRSTRLPGIDRKA
jgi:hypothetical protein